VSEVVTGLVGQGLSILDTLRKSTALSVSNGHVQGPGTAGSALDGTERS
jgi:hypothetical protein